MPIFVGSAQVQKMYIGSAEISAAANSGSNVLGPAGSFPGITNSSLYLPLKTSIVPSRGSSTPTFTRATAAWSFDNEGKLNLNVPSGCARFKGGRLVRNLVTGSSENITTGSKSGVTTPNASTVLADAGSSQHYMSRATATTPTIGHEYAFKVRLQKINHDYAQVAFLTASMGATFYASINLTTGEAVVNGANYFKISGVSSGIWDVEFSGNITAVSAPGVVFAVVPDILSSRNPVWTAVGTESFGILRVQIENVTGQTDQTASEYVSVGVLSSPYHGAGVDGCKWFPTNKDGSAIPSSTLEGYFAEPQRTNNCLWGRLLNIFSTGSSSSLRWLIPAGSGSSVLTNSDFSSGLTGWSTAIGGSITESGGVVTFVSDGGTPTLLQQSAVLTVGKTYSATVVINSGTGTLKLVTVSEIHGIGVGTTTFNFIADSATIQLSRMAGVACNLLIDSFSVKEAEIQVTTTTGLDNVTNSASRLTAAATDAKITQLLTASTGTRTLSAYIKRVSGSGTISLTRNGGTNWTDITSSLVTGSWVLVQMTSDVGANPTVGIKMGTSGDVIDVDCVQDENGAWATSPILTTTAAVTRNADVLSYASAFDVAQGTALCSVKSAVPINSGQTTNFLRGDSASAALAYVTSSNSRTATASTDGTNIASVSGGDITTGIRKKLVRWGSDLRMSADGSLGSSTAFDGSMGTVGTLYIGCNQSSIDHLSGTIREVHIWPTPLTDVQLQQVTR